MSTNILWAHIFRLKPDSLGKMQKGDFESQSLLWEEVG